MKVLRIYFSLYVYFKSAFNVLLEKVHLLFDEINQFLKYDVQRKWLLKVKKSIIVAFCEWCSATSKLQDHHVIITITKNMNHWMNHPMSPLV